MVSIMNTLLSFPRDFSFRCREITLVLYRIQSVDFGGDIIVSNGRVLGPTGGDLEQARASVVERKNYVIRVEVMV